MEKICTRGRLVPGKYGSASGWAMTDGQLLEQVATERQAAAFEELVRRHGPMVLRVCRRVLDHCQDAEDAFQATFLVLARKAGSIAKQESVGSWLHGVAYRIALKARVSASRRHAREKQMGEVPVAAAPQPSSGDWVAQELRPVLDEELERLPEKYRVPLILCYLEGKTTDECARELCWKRGTVASRTARGRDLLARRLTQRGLTLSAGALAGLALQGTAAAALPAKLVTGTTHAALTAAGGKAASTQATVLADAAVRSMAVAKLKTALAMVLIAVGIAAGVGAIALLIRPALPQRMVFLSFDGPATPVNKLGQLYPSPFFDPQRKDGGAFESSINTADAVAGASLQLRVTEGCLYASFNPYDRNRVRGFARDYVADPAGWRFNTYNRFRLWIKAPTIAPPHRTDGQANTQLGTYVKRVRDADTANDSTGGGHFTHRFNVPATGSWTQVVINMHPHFREGIASAADVGNLPHPTREDDYNYFDAMTGLFLDARSAPTRYPADYLLDEMEFYQEARPEEDERVYGIAATHVPGQGRLIVTWSRRIGEDAVAHEVRYAFTDIHAAGWDNATPAPRGIVSPLGQGAANGMVYDAADLPLAGRPMVYIAIKPQNSRLFSQIAVPLTLK